MDILHRFPVRRPVAAAAQKDQEHARMTLQEITSEVDAQARRFEEIRRLLFSRQCEQADTLSGGLRALCSGVKAFGSDLGDGLYLRGGVMARTCALCTALRL